MPRGILDTRQPCLYVDVMLVLRKTRQALGVTQDQLEERSGVSRETISRIERDETVSPRLSTLAALADALGVGITDLIVHESQPTNLQDTSEEVPEGVRP